MANVLRLLRGLTATLSLILVMGLPAGAAQTTVALWNLDDPVSQATVADVVGSHSGAVGDQSETLVRHGEAPVTGAPSGTFSTYFEGWRQGWSAGARCPSVTPSGALATVPDVGPDTDHGGGGGGLFDPKNRPFQFTVNLRGSIAATPSSPIPISGCSSSGAVSLNVMQQGFFKSAGGQYKLQIKGNGRPDCLFSDDGKLNASAVHSLEVTPTTATERSYNAPGVGSVYDPSTWYTITCRLLRPTPTTAVAQMIVTNVTTGVTTLTTLPAKTFMGINPCVGTSKTTCSARLQAIYFGKKPGSTDPRDAFSGWLDNVSFDYLD